MIGPALFTIARFVPGFLGQGYEVGGDWISPFSAIAQPISGLDMGETAPHMNAASILSGLIMIVGIVGTMTAIGTSRGDPFGGAARVAPLGWPRRSAARCLPVMRRGHSADPRRTRRPGP